MRISKRNICLGFSLLLFVSNFVFPDHANAGTITSAGSGIAYARATLGQSFTMPGGASGALTSLTVAGIRGRAPQLISCVRARIYANSAKTSILETSSNSICDTDASGTETSGSAANGAFIFSNSLMLSAGTQYFFELSVTSGATDFWTAQTYNASTGGGYSGGELFADGSFKASYDIVFSLEYTEAPDTVAPTFTSSSEISVAENIATSATAATIRVSESAAVTISSGVDAARFNITRYETNTAIIKFNNSPNFEVPVDAGSNNVYELTLTATDTSGNSGTQSLTITVTDVLDASAFNSFSLAGSQGTATFRTPIQIDASVTVASKVTFRAGGKPIPGCVSKAATGSGSSFTVSCSWSPSLRGVISISASSIPNNNQISGASANPISVAVVKRTSKR